MAVDQMIAKLGPLQLVLRELEMGGNNHHVSLCTHRPRFILYAGPSKQSDRRRFHHTLLQ